MIDIKYTQSDVEKIFRDNNLILMDKYINAKTKLLALDNEGYYIDISLTNLLSGKSGRRFSKSNRNVIENIKHFIDLDTNGEYEYVDGDYDNAHSLISVRHKKCGRIYQSKWCNLNRKPCDNDVNRNGTRCPHCNATQLESSHAIVLKQVWLHEVDGTVVEDESCINPLTNHPLPTDIVNHNLKIAIEIQSWFHDFDDQKKKDDIKKNYWLDNGYEFYAIDQRDYTILEMVQLFFPYIKSIPSYIDLEYSNRIDDVKIQQLLNDGKKVQEISKIVNCNPHAIYDAIRYGRIKYPKNYINDSFSPIIQLDLNKNFIKEYPSINEAIRNTGVKYISSALFHNRHYSGGYLWYYKNDFEENVI